MDVTMADIFGVLGDPRKWPKDNKPIKVETAAEYRARREREAEEDREIRQLIDEAMEGRAARHHAGERQRNEAAISAYVDQLLADELIRIGEKKLPSKKKRDEYMATFRECAEWCRETGVNWLPAAGPVIFAWLAHDHAPEKVAQRTRALRFVYESSREYLDTSYIAAAERWARIVNKKKENESGKENS